jgi:phosphoribosylglycinamide formyltransferase-1
VVILVSGRGSNMRAIIERSLKSDASYRVAAVYSDQPAAMGLVSARELGVEAHAFPKPKGVDRATYDESLGTAIDRHSPALVVLAGFMRILSKGFVEKYAGRLLNIHPSLLPKYPGLDTHRRVLEAGEKEHGATVHFVTEELDAGPAILQGRVEVSPKDTEDSLAGRVHVQEHRIYPMVVDWFGAGRLKERDGRAWLDGRRLDVPEQLDGGTALKAS